MPSETGNRPDQTTADDLIGAASREAFESLIGLINAGIAVSNPLGTDRREDGHYRDRATQSAWAVWVAAVGWAKGETYEVR